MSVGTLIQLGTVYNYVGVHADTKPTNVGAGSTFYETDTSNTYQYDGTTWNLYPLAVGGALTLNAGTNLIGKVGIDQTTPGTTNAVWAYVDHIVIRPTITTTDAAYTAGDNIGGIVTLSAPLSSGAPVKLKSIVLKDDANQKPDLTLLFFRSSPAGTYTDNAACVVSTADMGALVYAQKVVVADWWTLPGNSKAVVSYQLDEGIVLGPATTGIFLAIVAGAAPPDYGANATDLTAELGFERAV